MLKSKSRFKRFLAACIVLMIVTVNCSYAAYAAETPPNAALVTVDLVIFAGQSNMSGAGGDAKAAPGVPHGCGFEYRNGMDPAGLYEVVEPFGARANGYLSDPPELRGGTLVSAFMNAYYDATGVPVVGVSAARGGSNMVYWNDPAVQAELFDKYNNALAWCSSNNVKVRHRYVVWLQGETDSTSGMMSAEYQKQLTNVFTRLFANGLDQVFIITPGNLLGFENAYAQIVDAQRNLCAGSLRYTLGSDTLGTLPLEYLADGVHYNQAALNVVGAQTGAVAAHYSNTHK